MTSLARLVDLVAGLAMVREYHRVCRARRNPLIPDEAPASRETVDLW